MEGVRCSGPFSLDTTSNPHHSFWMLILKARKRWRVCGHRFDAGTAVSPLVPATKRRKMLTPMLSTQRHGDTQEVGQMRIKSGGGWQTLPTTWPRLPFHDPPPTPSV